MPPFLKKLLPHRSTAAAAAPAPTPHPTCLRWQGGDMISEEDVTLDRLLALCRQAFLQVESAPGGRQLHLRGDCGLRMALTVDRERMLICIAAVFVMKAEAPMAEKLAAANRLNCRVIFIRAAVADERTLYLDHQMGFQGGVSAAALVGAVRRMDRIATTALAETFGSALL